MSTKTDHNKYMAEYMRGYRARKAAELAELRAKEEQREPTIEAMLTNILEAITALSERVSSIEAVLTQINVNELTETHAKNNVSKLTKTNVNKGKPSTKVPLKRMKANVKPNELTEVNVNEGEQHSDVPAAAELAREAKTLHEKGLSYEQIARRWTEAGIPTLKGGRWHKGTIAKIVQRLNPDTGENMRHSQR